MEATSWIPIIGIVVVGHLCWTAWCCWKLKKRVSDLETWATGVTTWFHNWYADAIPVLECAVTKTECDPGSGGGWPPPPPGDFPPGED